MAAGSFEDRWRRETETGNFAKALRQYSLIVNLIYVVLYNQVVSGIFPVLVSIPQFRGITCSQRRCFQIRLLRVPCHQVPKQRVMYVKTYSSKQLVCRLLPTLTSMTSGVAIFSKTSCAMRSPRLISKGVLLKLKLYKAK